MQGKKLYLLILLSFFCYHNIHAQIENYFKPANGKSNFHFHQVKNVDFIYVINLDQRPEKFEHCVAELMPYEIYPYRFSAVNGWELSLDDINHLGVVYQPDMPSDLWGTSYFDSLEPQHEVMHVVGRNYFSHCVARGTIGIVLSHLSILQDAYNSGYETIWVMEDDIKVIENPHLISQFISKLDGLVGKNNWDILFTDPDTKNNQGIYVPCLSYARLPNFFPKNTTRFSQRKDIHPEFRKIGARYGAYSMIVRRSGMKKILDFLKKYKIFLPYDMEYYLPDSVTMYTVTRDIVSTQPQAISDNGAPGYQKK